MNNLKKFLAFAAIAFGFAGAATAAVTEVGSASALTSAISSAAAGDTIKLTANISQSITVSKTITLDLNGFVLKASSGRVITLSGGSSGNLTIIDSSPNTVHYYTVGSNGLWTWNDSSTSGAVAFETLTERPTSGIVALKGGAITGGATEGGAIYGYSGTTINLQAGNIVGNRTASTSGTSIQWGPAVKIDWATLNMSGGNIVGNALLVYGKGGGVDCRSGTVNMTGGSICFNRTVEAGGGIGIRSGGRVVMTGGSIRGNYDGWVGCGIYYESGDGSVSVGGTAVIAGNKAGTSESNVRLRGSNVITVLTGDDAPQASMKIGVYKDTWPTRDNPVAITGENGTDYAVNFFSDAAMLFTTNDQNTVKLYGHIHCLCGDDACTAGGHTHADLYWTPWTSTTSLPTSAGNWYLTNDVTLAAAYVPVTGVNLCLNGHVVKQTGSNVRAFYLNTGVSLTLTDCVGCGKVTGGNLSGGDNNSSGGAVFANTGSTFTMYGGSLTGNSGWNGGAIYNVASTVKIHGGSIENNTARGWGGGFCIINGGTNELHNCMVRNNKANQGQGGAVRMDLGTLSLVDCVVTNNTAGSSDGGVSYISNAASSVSLGGATVIKDNHVGSSTAQSNLIVPSGLPVIVNVDEPLTDGAEIGVTTATKPSGATKVPVTSNRGDDLAYFTSDEGYNVIKENDQVKLMGDVSFTLTFYNRPTSNDETIDGQPFNNAPTNVVYNYGGSTAQTPNVVKQNAKFLGWSTSPTGTVPEYTNDQLSTITTTPEDNITLYSVYGVEVGVPVYVAMDDCSTLPDDGREYSFAITNLDSFTTLPTNCVVTLSMPTGRGEANCVGFGPEDIDNPWRLTYTAGDYYYHVSQITNGCHAGEKLDEGTWEIMITVNPDATPRYKVESAIYYGKVADLDEDSFQIVKADDAVAAAVTVEGSKTKVALGGDKVVSGDGFNTAVMKGKFEIDFSRNFRVVGSFTPPNSSVPDGTCIGFMPYAGSLSQSDVHGGGLLGYMGCTKFAKSVVLDFDPYLNGSTYGDPDYKHFSLTETKDNGYPNYNTAQHKNVASCWPTSASQYTILNDTTENKLYFKVTLPNSTVLEYEYANPTNFFKASKAYFFMSGVVRKGPANSYGCGAAGSTAPSLTMYFDSFNYLGQPAGYDSIPGLFVNRQEALVKYHAWGGKFADGEETLESFAEDAKTTFPTDPTRAGYGFDGWYGSWTNGAAKASEGLLNPIADLDAYAKWISPSTPEGEGEKTLDFELDGDGAVLKGATNQLATTDLAIPEFTSNGADGIPYVVIKHGAFTRESYDKQRELELRAAKVPRTYQTTNNLTSVIVSTYVTNVQSSAFANCGSITNIVFSRTRDYATGEPAKLYIADLAFSKTSVRTIDFPAGSTVVLDYGSFNDAQYLEDVYFRGDVEVRNLYPFLGAGSRYVAADPANNRVRIHLSAKLAADPAFVASLTNGMAAAKIQLDQDVIGATFESCTAPTFESDTLTFTFKVAEESDWTAVNEDTVYLFWSTSLDENTFIGNTPLKPRAGELVRNADGTWTAAFDKPETSGSSSAFFKLRIGAER